MNRGLPQEDRGVALDGQRWDLRTIAVMVWRRRVPIVLVGHRDLLLMIMLCGVIIDLEKDLTGQGAGRMIKAKAMLSLVDGGDGDLTDKHRRQRHAKRSERDPQSSGAQTKHRKPSPDVRY